LQLLRRTIIPLLVSVSLLWLFILYAKLTLPNIDELKIQNPISTAFMELYKGETLLSYRWIPYTEISPYLKQSVVIAEDSAFFDHKGFDWNAIWEALEKNWKKKEFARGASTITQQLAKNLYLSPSKNPVRKIREILITIALEQRLSKQRILELYLNVVEWGEGIFGAEAAAQHYFNVKASQLSAYQAAWLASILPNPRYYEKHRNSSFIARKVSRTLGLMGLEPKKEKPQPDEILEEEILDEF